MNLHAISDSDELPELKDPNELEYTFKHVFSTDSGWDSVRRGGLLGGPHAKKRNQRYIVKLIYDLTAEQFIEWLESTGNKGLSNDPKYKKEIQ